MYKDHGSGFTVMSGKPSAMASWIRRHARKDGLWAHKSRKDGLWYFADEWNCLQSPQDGFDDHAAVEYPEGG